MDRRERRPGCAACNGERGRGLVATLALLVIVGLGAGVGYLASDLNHRRFRLISAGGHLVVERGLLLPMGFERWTPSAPELAQAYAPLQLPEGAKFTVSETFEERADLDRALFGLLSSWARERATGGAPEFELAVSYARRAELLPGLSEDQRAELHQLRGELAYRAGHQLLGDAVRQLERARDQFRAAAELGPPRGEDARRWAAEADRRIAELARAAPPEVRADATPTLGAAAPPPTATPPPGALPTSRSPDTRED